ncbi:MAG: hypothetical protein GDA44_09430 [Prochloron sp. SP5CPC1]|nr:hypothetical protein [Candidatus Paraprochloron terpiosi SP5CPC1]
MEANFKSTMTQLQRLIKQLSVRERWALLKWLLELLQRESQTAPRETVSPETSVILDEYPDEKFYGSIDDPSFIRQSLDITPEREPIS